MGRGGEGRVKCAMQRLGVASTKGSCSQWGYGWLRSVAVQAVAAEHRVASRSIAVRLGYGFVGLRVESERQTATARARFLNSHYSLSAASIYILLRSPTEAARRSARNPTRCLRLVSVLQGVVPVAC